MRPAAFQPEHFGDVFKPHAVGITVDEKDRGFRGFEFLGAEVEWLDSYLYEALHEPVELVRCRAQSLVLGLDGRTFERFRLQLGERFNGFFDETIGAERERNADNFPDFVRVANSKLHGNASTHAVAQHICLWDLQIVEQGRYVVGEIFITEIAVDIGGATMALHFDCDNLPAFFKPRDRVRPIFYYRH